MERIIAILEKIDRQGMDKVIEYLRASNYATAYGGSHHTYEGGLVDHSFEVYERMMERREDLPEESVAICAFLHDLGKTECAGFACRGHHPRRAVSILSKCGFSLTPAEKLAIAQHHSKSKAYFSHPLRYCLSSSDMCSTGKWKTEHPDPNESLYSRIKNAALYAFSKKL